MNNRRLRRPLLLTLIAVPLVAASYAHAQTAPEVLESVRESLGLMRLTPGHALHLVGTARYLGSSAAFDALFDAEGRSIVSIVGPLTTINGFDGITAWTTDLGGETRAEHLGDRATNIATARILSGLWFNHPSSSRFAIDDSRTTDSSITLTFNHDEGRAAGSVEVDRTTWRPEKWSLSTGPTMLTWEFAGDIAADGIHVPERIAFATTHSESNLLTITRAEVIPVTPERFAMPAASTVAHRFDPAAPAALEIKKAPTGHLLVRASWDGGEPGWFIFDTGAGMNCIDNGIIAERGYEKIGEVPAMGVGGAVTSPFVRPKSLRVGPLTLDAPICVGLDLKGLSAYMGEPIQGIVGYNTIARAVTEIDTVTPSVSLYNPVDYRLVQGEWTQMMLYERHPCFTGSIEGRPALFKIDTGASRTTICYRAVEGMKLLEGRETKPSKMGGVGGFVESALGSVALLEFAGTRHENITVDFAKENKGALADSYVAVNVGGKLIADYRLILDYQNNRAALVKK